ncbi:unnamed protein product [Blumeria hordei]|uniref:Uncharacterized protein n=1 Tax=Blumeria hordei TaxID=2867405 RepID=A0A383UV76_BLUHO|nr:unnamed protein product [Blumeria hordei]
MRVTKKPYDLSPRMTLPCLHAFPQACFRQ